MRKFLSVAGILLAAALIFVQPSKADNFDTYQLTGHGQNISFTVPQTLTPSSVTWNGIINVQNVSGTFNGAAYTFATVQPGATGWSNFTNYWAFGSGTKSFELIAPGLFTWNSNGTVTLNVGNLTMGDYNMFSGGVSDYHLNIVDPPGANSLISTPEPASLILLNVGGVALGILRRRKAA